jgi:hypothetical protein
LGLVSPLVRSVQGFLGIKNEVDFTGIFQKEKNEVRQESINSIQRLVREGREVFDNIRGERRVYVFVDDLDRCLPDVALDLLEAIKNFLNVGLTFIVAADEALIGQGLRLRYKEMLNQNSGDVDKYIATKGREYFEKIIQFGVRVPPRTPEQAHRFIAAQFPQWQPATDIIQTALGTNPRRLKQYCNLLSYKRLVGDVPLSMRSQENLILSRPIGSPAQPQVLNVTGEWYEKLIAQIASCFSSTSMAEDMLGLFLDPRIRRWRSKLPDDPELSAEAYYRLIVDFLIDSYDDGGQSGLFPFLEVFEEKTLEGNCRDEIKFLLEDLLLMQDDGEVANE